MPHFENQHQRYSKYKCFRNGNMLGIPVSIKRSSKSRMIDGMWENLEATASKKTVFRFRAVTASPMKSITGLYFVKYGRYKACNFIGVAGIKRICGEFDARRLVRNRSAETMLAKKKTLGGRQLSRVFKIEQRLRKT